MKKLAVSMLLGAGVYSTAQAGVTLSAFDAIAVDTRAASVDSTQTAVIDFVNNSGTAVDLYWIDYDGNREFFYTMAPGESYYQPTYISHPWLVVESGTGGTTDQGTGKRLTAFAAATPDVNDAAHADVAYINSTPCTATVAQQGDLLTLFVPLAEMSGSAPATSAYYGSFALQIAPDQTISAALTAVGTANSAPPFDCPPSTVAQDPASGAFTLTVDRIVFNGAAYSAVLRQVGAGNFVVTSVAPR